MQGNATPLEQPPDRRLERTTVTAYDLVIGVLLLIVLAAYFAISWASTAWNLAGGNYAAAVFLSLIPAILLYHFLDTRARFIKGWISLTGAGAIAAAVVAGSYAWNERDIDDAKNTIAQLQADIDARQLVTIYVPINDATGEIRGRSQNFVFGILLQGDILEQGGENVGVVEDVPRARIYRALGFQRKDGELGRLIIKLERMGGEDERLAGRELTFSTPMRVE